MAVNTNHHNYGRKRPDMIEIARALGKAQKGCKRTDEFKLKISIAKKGKPISEEHKQKIKELNELGIIGMKGRTHSEETKIKISQSNKKIWTEEKRKLHGERFKGRVISDEQRKQISEKLTGRPTGRNGDKNHNWKGGVTPEYKRIRKSPEYIAWRIAVFERDNYTCVICGEVGGRLNADHIKSFADYPELRFALENGRTLCVKCHRKTDTWGWNIKHMRRKISQEMYA